MSNKQTHFFQFPVEWPNAFVSAVKNNWLAISEYDVLSVQNAVKYDIARKLEYSEQGIYVLSDTLARLKQEENNMERKNNFLTVVK